MSKHPLDHPRGAPATRVRKFLDVERLERPGAAITVLKKRQRKQSASRLRRFVTIERQAMA